MATRENQNKPNVDPNKPGETGQPGGYQPGQNPNDPSREKQEPTPGGTFTPGGGYQPGMTQEERQRQESDRNKQVPNLIPGQSPPGGNNSGPAPSITDPGTTKP